MEFVALDVRGLGNRTYVLVDGAVAAVVDPPRDIAPIEAAAAHHGARIAVVLETHRHADYVSGGLELSRRHHATYVVPPGEPEPAFGFRAAVEGLRCEIGDMSVRVVATPGHTPHHVAYVVEDASGPVAVCTGGSLLHGSVGRTDLHGSGRTLSLAHAQWQSARRLAAELPADTRVLPTHGFGSLCSATPASSRTSMTLREAATTNPALTIEQGPFGESLVAGYGPVPRHYRRLPLLNAAGPTPMAAVPPPPHVDVSALPSLARDGHWLVDVRPRRSFAEAHLAGALNVEVTGALSAYLPWLLPPGSGVVLLGDGPSVAEAGRQMRVVGLDAPAAVVTGSPREWSLGGGTLRSYPVRDAGALAEVMAGGDVLVLDVRSAQERSTSNAPGTTHLPLPELADAWAGGALTGGLERRPVWVYCAAGFRASIAASMLDAAGVPVTLVDAPHDAVGAACAAAASPRTVDLTSII